MPSGVLGAGLCGVGLGVLPEGAPQGTVVGVFAGGRGGVGVGVFGSDCSLSISIPLLILSLLPTSPRTVKTLLWRLLIA